ncbi:geranylgeranyl diphosphate synthase, type I [Saccharopolyspora antimicrobica]|uniref:Geranylgeranyl diphosphate synthase type I n=1 Tax=Saccharopolyspora antimicrobica TaxID=455193 RepID=A0A1I4U3M9_9PSEU|nr:polyprenyl synthetase family protein [Saccharopolyspora antimicrobica]RKT88661.1 geranylgeranyl diphosphate synthase type I [Saccharopolyspora antimicrobica]SFM83421.1 geranylgeranyl diphosphate synthase, type I [Saccharopolyspora antimicrobica]
MGMVDLDEIRAEVDSALAGFFDRATLAGGIEPHSDDMIEVIEGFVLTGGKRIRPVLCALGWLAADPQPRCRAPLIGLAAGLEMFHAAILIHDDVMDRSATRRGRPTVHRVMAGLRPDRGGEDGEWYGTCAAIVLGDLALAWADKLTCAQLSAEQLGRVLPQIAQMRHEVTIGQYLDLHSAGARSADADLAEMIIRYKTAYYTVYRPLSIGAAAGNASREATRVLHHYGMPVGKAFQLRDDLLGVFGDPLLTGKAVTDDAREGKHTTLIAHALTTASSPQAVKLGQLWGKRDITESEVDVVREILTSTGTVRAVENLITDHHRAALAALETPHLPTEVAEALRTIADQAVERDR